MSHELQRRENYLRNLTAEKLRDAFAPRHLPAELWWAIAAYLVSGCAVAAVMALMRDDEYPFPEEQGDGPEYALIDPSKDVYASYLQLDGIRYIKGVRNTTKAETGKGEYLLVDATGYRATHKVYVAYDHLGIRQIQFASPNCALPGPESIPGVYWRSFDREDGMTHLMVKTDVCPPLSIVQPSSPS